VIKHTYTQKKQGLAIYPSRDRRRQNREICQSVYIYAKYLLLTCVCVSALGGVTAVKTRRRSIESSMYSHPSCKGTYGIRPLDVCKLIYSCNDLIRCCYITMYHLYHRPTFPIRTPNLGIAFSLSKRSQSRLCNTRAFRTRS
jgi:hypothetical protein